MIVSVSQTLLCQVESLVNCLRTKCPQFDMDGIHNVWIVKPGAKSRGRGRGQGVGRGGGEGGEGMYVLAFQR